jgi:glycosyltransferase involved in cell wall biosynthesis
LKDFILIIPYLNNKEGLLRSLKSIQYPRDLLEVIVVDDGSPVALIQEDVAGFLDSFSQLMILRSEENRGVAPSLNLALTELLNRKDYKYIARLDCGDLCVNDRLLKQVRYLDQHPEISLLGTRVLFKNFLTGKEYQYQNKSDYKDIKREMHFKCSFIHPSVMFRREVLSEVGLYPENYLHCEDYAFFYKIIRQYRAANLPEILLISEINEGGISTTNRKRQMLSRIKVISRFGTNPFLKAGGILRLLMLLIAPFRLVRFLNTLK